MQSRVLAVVAMLLASACGSDEIELLTCDPGPAVHANVESCELAIEGNGGPKAAVAWTIETDDHTEYDSYELASDGGVYVFASDDPKAIVARFDPTGKLEWSRSLITDETLPDDAADVVIDASAAGPEGLDVVMQTQHGTTVLIHLRDTGECGKAVALVFGGEQHGNVGNMAREQDGLVLTGTHSPGEYSRSFIQRRSLAGELIVEAEIVDANYYDVGSPWVRVGGPERYVVSYSGYAPSGLWSSYSSGQLFDESLNSIGRSGGPYTSDAFGRLYTVSSNATMGDPWAQPPIEPQPPTMFEVTRSQTPDAPAGETLELEVPQPRCGSSPSVALFDESLLIVVCNPPDSPRLLLGYDGAGPPAWSATGSCLGADGFLSLPRFTEDRRLWATAGSGTDKSILSVAF